jgi:hypothetical protein
MLKTRRRHSTCGSLGVISKEARNLEIWPEGRGEIRIAPQPREEAAAEFPGDPVNHGQIVGPLIAYRRSR